MVRRACYEDIELIKKAQAASTHEFEANSDMELFEALKSGNLVVFIHEFKSGFSVVGCAVDDSSALLCMFYREAHPNSIYYDCEHLWYTVRWNLQKMGINKVSLYVSKKNPKYNGLIKLYERLGFNQDMTRMSREL